MKFLDKIKQTSKKVIASVMAIFLIIVGGVIFEVTDDNSLLLCGPKGNSEQWNPIGPIYDLSSQDSGFTAFGQYRCPVTQDDKYCKRLSNSGKSCYIITIEEANKIINISAVEIEGRVITRTPSIESVCNGGSCLIKLFSGRVNFWNGSDYEPVNFSIVPSADAIYEFEAKGAFYVFFREDPTNGETVKFFFNESFLYGNNPHKSGFVTFQPLSLRYSNDLSQIQEISDVQSVTGVAIGNTFTYPSIYGDGFNLSYIFGGNELVKILSIDNFNDLPSLEQFIIDGGNPTLEMDFNLAFDDALDVFINGVIWDEAPNNPQTTTGSIDFQLNGDTLFTLPVPTALDNDGSGIIGKYNIRRQGNNFFVTVIYNYSWFNDSNRVYPVFIDPTITLSVADSENLDDTMIRSSPSTSNFGTGNFLRVLNDTTNHMTIMIQWNITSIPADQTIVNATLNLTVAVNGLDDPDTLNLTIRRQFNNYTCVAGDNHNPWDEECPTWDNGPDNDSTLGFIGPVVDGVVVDFNTATNIRLGFDVTSIISDCYTEGRANCSFYMDSGLLAGNPAFGPDRFEFDSKEAAGTVDDPILFIGHVDAAAGDPDLNATLGVNVSLLRFIADFGTGSTALYVDAVNQTTTNSALIINNNGSATGSVCVNRTNPTSGIYLIASTTGDFTSNVINLTAVCQVIDSSVVVGEVFNVWVRKNFTIIGIDNSGINFTIT